jgi:hypothetical protein
LCAVVLWQVASGESGSAASTGASAQTPAVAAASATPDVAWLPFDPRTPPAAGSAGADPSEAVAAATATATARPTARQTARPTPKDRPFAVDPALVLAKNEGRVTVDAAGLVEISSVALQPPAYATAASLPTAWSGLIQEPPTSGKDDKGAAFVDYNYKLLCGPGTAAVVLFYFPASHAAVTTRSTVFREPVDLGRYRYAATYWKAQDAGGNGRGMIAYLAAVEWPAPDKGLSWWSRPGIIRWATHPATYVENLVDALNWEASGRTRLNYFYVSVPASSLTASALLDHVHTDIGMGLPVAVATRTSDGIHSLPAWRLKSRRSAGNHFITIVGYDDNAGTYTVIDTCGLTCNDRNVRGGVETMTQQAVYALIEAESDNDGIIW